MLPLGLAHLPYRKGSFEDYVGAQALKRDGKRKWRKRVADVVARLLAALVPDDVVIGGGNLRLLTTLPPGCRAGDNANAFIGGFRMWAGAAPAAAPRKAPAARMGIGHRGGLLQKGQVVGGRGRSYSMSHSVSDTCTKPCRW